VRARGNIGKDTRDATGLSPWCFADAGPFVPQGELKSGGYIAAWRGESAGRHPCSTAWRDVRGLRPAVLLLGSEDAEAENLRMRYRGALQIRSRIDVMAAVAPRRFGRGGALRSSG
jgi:hypothetical protein